MADSTCFDRTCEILESQTALDRLEARGTVRLTLKAGGLDSRTVTPEQMGIVVEKLLPGELAARGIGDAPRIQAAIRDELAGMDAALAPNAPEAVFARLGGS